jgi:5-methyltetrahydropteroyltriglutamate--homocysteine methyltransferase
LADETALDVIRSGLRPEFIDARQRRAEGEMLAREFKGAEDAPVHASLRLQEHAGRDVVTEGEMRRASAPSEMTRR